MELSWERRHLSSIFGERWPLAYFVFSRCYFGSLGVGEVRFGVEGSQFVEGCQLSPIPGEGGFQPIVCFQPARSVGEGFFWQYRQVVDFFGCAARFWSLTVSSGIVLLVICVPGYPGCVIKG